MLKPISAMGLIRPSPQRLEVLPPPDAEAPDTSTMAATARRVFRFPGDRVDAPAMNVVAGDRSAAAADAGIGPMPTPAAGVTNRRPGPPVSPLDGEAYLAYLREPERARWFWDRVLIGTDPQAHWLWNGPQGTPLRTGHVRIWMFGVRLQVHRAAYFLSGGSPEDGELIRHRCPGDPRPDCCNPAHLSAGTPLSNAQDRDDAGRRTPFLPRGEQHWSAKLTQDDADRIRDARRLGVPVRDVMQIWRVSRATVYSVTSHQRYTAPR